MKWGANRMAFVAFVFDAAPVVPGDKQTGADSGPAQPPHHVEHDSHISWAILKLF